MSDKAEFLTRATAAYARFIVGKPGPVLAVLLLLALVSGFLASKLTIEPDQLQLISQELPEVKEVKRIVDMVGGAGYLTLAFRADDAPALKKTADAMAKVLEADKENVRFFTYKIPVEFIQENMVLFIDTEDLIEGKKRVNAYLRDQIRRQSPFFIEIRKTEPVKLDLQDLITKYGSVGKKSIRDDFYISPDKKMLIMLIKPMWNSTELARTDAYLTHLRGQVAALAKDLKVELVEDYHAMGTKDRISFGLAGTYKTALDDSYSIQASLEPVSIVAFISIFLITMIFFRGWAPTVLVISGTVLGTLFTMGFAKATLGELNSITSLIGGILMGFGVDYGIHFIFRTRIELGLGKPYDEALRDAVTNAGRPALVTATVTGGSFFVLLVSEFRGFSQFGFLAGFGAFIIAFALFSWVPAILSLLGRYNPDLPKKLVGTMKLSEGAASGDIRIPRPGLVLGGTLVFVAAVCAFAVPWVDMTLPKGRPPTMLERLKGGVHFDYNTRALLSDEQPSMQLADEISARFQISADPVAVSSKTIEEVKELWDELKGHPEKYPSIDQVVSLYSFVPPPDLAAKNAEVLAEWKKELADIDVESLPPDMQDNARFFLKVLDKKPFGVESVPEVYASQFRHLKTTKVENHGYLTFIYPGVDLWDGKKMLQFADEVRVITTASGKQFRAAGLPLLYATLARIVLFDGKLTVLLAALWILAMHYMDFRDVKLAAASVIPLFVGLAMMLGLMSMINLRLNFMNLVILPILLGFGVSHGLYLLHRFLEGTSPMTAFQSVGAAVASSTLTTIAGFAALHFAAHNGLKSIGYVACLGLLTTLFVSFSVLAATLQLLHDARTKKAKA